jgi:pyruvate kinase
VIAVGNFSGEPGRVSTSYEYLPSLVKPGDMLLLDDGRIQLRVEASDRQQIRTVVVDGGISASTRGSTRPGVPLPASGLTEKDKADLAFRRARRRGLRGHELRAERRRTSGQARAALRDGGAPGSAAVAKLERPEAIEALDDILHACDAVMVGARRPGPRAAAAERAARPEGDLRARAHAGRTGDRGDAGLRIDDQGAAPHARRSERRRQRRR